MTLRFLWIGCHNFRLGLVTKVGSTWKKKLVKIDAKSPLDSNTLWQVLKVCTIRSHKTPKMNYHFGHWKFWRWQFTFNSSNFFKNWKLNFEAKFGGTNLVQIGLWKNHWIVLEKYHVKMGLISKTKTCNTSYGHLKGWESDLQNNWPLNHLKSTLVFKT